MLLRLAPPAGTPVAAAPPLHLEARYQDRWGGVGCCCVLSLLARR